MPCHVESSSSDSSSTTTSTSHSSPSRSSPTTLSTSESSSFASSSITSGTCSEIEGIVKGFYKNYLIRRVVEAFDESPSPSSSASSTTTQNDLYATLQAVNAVYRRRGYEDGHESGIRLASSRGDESDNAEESEIASPTRISSPPSSMTPPSPSPLPRAPPTPTQRLLLTIAKQRGQKQLSKPDRPAVPRK
ncbi:MAG: hypothetical protein Q9224_006875, partial [Gallowayella concinna]